MKNLRKAYFNVPAYLKLIKKHNTDIDYCDWEDLPIMEKSFLDENESGTISPEYYREYMMKKLISNRTSGTTGQYLEIQWSKSDYTRSMIPLWLWRKRNFGINPSDRLAYFFTDGVPGENYRTYKEQFGVCKNLLNEKDLIDVVKKINEWKPQWMLLQPSTAAILFQFLEKSGSTLPGTVSYIEFSGEVLTTEVRDILKFFRNTI